MKKTLLIAAFAAFSFCALAQTTVVVKDQVHTNNGSTVTRADDSKVIAYTNQNDGIWFLGNINMADVDYIEVKGATFASQSNGTKAQLRLAFLPAGTITDMTTENIAAQSSTIRAANNNLARITAETLAADGFTIPSGKNITHYVGADFKITATGVEKISDGNADQTVTTLDSGSNTFGIQKTDATYQVFLYGNASSRRLAVDEVVFHFKNTTGISTIEAQKAVKNGEVFNLAGQRVAQPTKGLYIVGGKKVMMK